MKRDWPGSPLPDSRWSCSLSVPMKKSWSRAPIVGDLEPDRACRPSTVILLGVDGQAVRRATTSTTWVAIVGGRGRSGGQAHRRSRPSASRRGVGLGVAATAVAAGSGDGSVAGDRRSPRDRGGARERCRSSRSRPSSATSISSSASRRADSTHHARILHIGSIVDAQHAARRQDVHGTLPARYRGSAHASLNAMATADPRPNAAVRAEPPRHRHGGRPRPARARGQAARRAAGPGHRGAGGRGAARRWSSASAARRSRFAVGTATAPRGPARLAGRDWTRIDLPRAEVLIRAFSLYFQLTNLAEEKQRVRRLRQRARQAGTASRRVDGGGRSRCSGDRARREPRRASLEQLSIGLVLTAHPTEARRRTLLLALRRCYRLLDQLDDPRLTPTEDAEIRRRLREEISLLWHTSPLRVLAARRRSTRCAPRWRSSTSRCSS